MGNVPYFIIPRRMASCTALQRVDIQLQQDGRNMMVDGLGGNKKPGPYFFIL